MVTASSLRKKSKIASSKINAEQASKREQYQRHLDTLVEERVGPLTKRIENDLKKAASGGGLELTYDVREDDTENTKVEALAMNAVVSALKKKGFDIQYAMTPNQYTGQGFYERDFYTAHSWRVRW